jgi:hypothetical protein
MIVKKLIKILQKIADPDLSDMEFYYKYKRIQIKHIGQFGTLTDSTMEFEDFKGNDSPAKPASFQRKSIGMVKRTWKKIQKENK